MQNLRYFVLLGWIQGLRGVEGALNFFYFECGIFCHFLLGMAFVYGGSGEVGFLGNNYIGFLENWQVSPVLLPRTYHSVGLAALKDILYAH